MKKIALLILSLFTGIFLFGQNHWTPDESIYTNTMSIIAVLDFDNIEQADTDYEIGVFCDEELRGSNKVQYTPDLNRYFFFITVYGNDGDLLTFRLYDHEMQTELDYHTETTLEFVSNGVEGDVSSPFVINFNTFQSNHWNPDFSLYDATMSVVAVVTVNGDELREEDCEVGVFCGEDVRGSGRTQYIPDFDRYFVFLTVCGKDNEEMTFKLYDHKTQQELYYETETTLSFVTDKVIDIGDPLTIEFISAVKIYTFVGDGSWDDEYNWRNNKKPTIETDNVVIDGNAYLSSEAVITSLVINENMSLTIEDGGLLEVKEEFSNTDFDALIINDGGQLIQSNEGVAATFKKNIVNPTGQWGEEDNTGWQFISSPMINSLVSDFMPEYGDYDLYKYDGTLEKQWYNYKYSVNYDFDETEQDWYSIDADGDGYKWWMIEGELCSFSYDEGSGNPLKPDNYLVFPKIMIEDGMCFDFSVKAGDGEYPEFCGVAVSDDGTTFEMINDGWIIDNSEWEKKSVRLDDYVGQELFVAIRHYNVTDAYCLLVDNVSLNLESASLENGLSYLVSYESDNTAEFKGILNNKDVCTIKTNYSSTDNMVNYNLVGNPFSYNLNWATDVKLVGISEGYAIIQNNGAYEYKTDGIIKVGCGVMLHSSMSRNHNITMKKGTKQSKRNVDASINIIASNNEGSDNVIIRFDEENKSNFPKLANFNDRIANVYVKENDTVYGIYTYKAEVNEIPVHFDAKEMGNYKLTFDVKGDYENLYLIDKMTGEKIDLLVENEYSFIANSNDNTERFIIKMDNSQQTTGNSHFVYVSGEELVINAEGTIQIIDMMGRVVMTEENHNGSINISELNNAAYIVRCVNEKEVRTQKIVVL